jgi:hypothetical protein
MRSPRTTLSVVALTVITTVVLAGCGSGGSGSSKDSSTTASAQTLLRKTFSGKHAVTSGQIELSVKLVPTGSSELTAPITVTFGGPFESASKGKLPQSDFTVEGSAQGHTGKLAIVSTGSAGYITVDGDSYQLPATSYAKLKSGLSSVSGSSAASSSTSGSSMLGKLGIDPLSWLAKPKLVGQATVAGVKTDHITATVNVTGLLKDLDKLAGKASELGVKDASKISGGIPAADQAKIAAHIKSPSFDIWTGVSDQTLRKLAVGVTIPVTGSVQKSLGGLTSVRITLSLQYADLNQPQTITAPAKVLPYSQFQTKIASVLETIESGVSGGELGSLGGTSTSSNLSGVDKRYSECIVKAAGDVAKQQKCTSILGG